VVRSGLHRTLRDTGRSYWAMVFVAALALNASGSGDRTVADARAALEKWVETKRLICKEQQDWRAEQALLGDHIDLVRRETEALKQTTEEVTSSIGEADQKLAESTAKIDELKTATAGLHERIGHLEADVLALLKRVPTPIAERVKPLSQRMPKPDIEIKMGLAERFQNVIGILNELNKFSREITITSEVREQPDGAKAEVTVIYIGLAGAYYANAVSGLAGIGRPGPEGWVWESRNGLAQAVSDAIAIQRNERPAAYVVLPGALQ